MAAPFWENRDAGLPVEPAADARDAAAEGNEDQADTDETRPPPIGIAPGLPLVPPGAADEGAIQTVGPGSAATRPLRNEIGQLNALAVARLAASDYTAAIDALRRVLNLTPDSPAAHGNLALGLWRARQAPLAEVHARRAIALNPSYLSANRLLAELLRERDAPDALGRYERLLALDPDDYMAHNNAGLIYGKLRRYAEADAALARAQSLRPDEPNIQFNRLMLRRDDSGLAEAIDCSRRALEQQPNSPDVMANFAVVLQFAGRHDEALALYERALAVDPEHRGARFNQSLLLLLLGDYERGWKEYEHRWKVVGVKKPAFAQPEWEGERLDGKTILLHSEQGYGDTIQFLRFVPAIAAVGGRVILRLERPLVRLAASVAGNPIISPTNARLPKFDVWSPMLSLPRILGTRPDAIPAETPYLGVRPPLAERWRRRFSGLPGLKVGLAWAGSPRHVNDFRRSIDPARLAPLFDLPGVSWGSLQVGPPVSGIAALPADKITNLSDELSDFAETAGAILDLDLVITVDTVVAHIAGALNRPAWVLLPFAPDWRWMLDRTDSPWYPSLRLYRQPAPGDWDSTIARVRADLAALAAERVAAQRPVELNPAHRETPGELADSGPGVVVERPSAAPGPLAVEVLSPQRRAELETLARTANAHFQAKRYEECETALRRILALDAVNSSALHVLALTRFHRHDTGEAIDLMPQAIALEPNNPRLKRDYGILLHEAGRFAEARDAIESALALNPHDPATHNSLGAALSALDRPADAIDAYRRALTIRPSYHECWNNLAHAQQLLQRLDDAADSYRHALGIKADYVQAQCNAGLLALLRGDYANGFTQFEWRWQLDIMQPRDFKQPPWQGEPLNGRALLLHAEQGYGDTIQCLRFLPQVTARGARLVLEVPRPLARLATSLDGGGEIVPTGQPLPPFDVHCAFMSLPRVLGTTLENLPAAVPYLHAEANAVKRWSQRLAGAGLKIGIAWAGNPQHSADRRRSIDFERLAPLFEIPGCRFYSLQIGQRAADLAPLPTGKIVDLAQELHDFAETAAVMANLDLVLAVDTAVVHLAGALGRRCWLILPFAPDWRWLTGRSDSPWYPTLRLFRQPSFGDWDAVIAEIAEALASLASMDDPARQS